MKKKEPEKIGDHMVGSSNTSTCSTIADEMLRSASDDRKKVKPPGRESIEG